MKTKIFSLLSAAAIVVGFSACQDPYEFVPEHHEENLLSVTGSFFNDNNPYNAFPAEINHAEGTIKIVFPYTYPPETDSHLEGTDLTHVRVQSNLVLGATVEPDLTWLDLTKDHQITVTGLDGSKKQYTITSEIRKSALCVLSDLTLVDSEISGAIDQNSGIISIISMEDLGEQNATIIMSHGATISPDPRTQKINFDQDTEFTVTAQNGVDKKVYKTVKGVPTLIASGADFSRTEIVWSKKLIDDYGFTKATGVNDNHSGIAVVGNYLVLNQTGVAQATYVNAKTGAKEGTIDLSAVGYSTAGYLNNYRMTSDNNNNIVISSFSKDNGGSITVWRKKGLDGAIEPYINYAAGKNVGDQLSVVGSLDGDAIITASINGSNLEFLRWTVKGGALTSQTPESVTFTGYEGTCWGNADIVYTDPSNTSSDYISAAYMKFADQETVNRGLAYVSAATNKITSEGSRVVSSNWVINAADVIEFNKTKYVIHNSINTFTWGSDDNIYIYDLSAGDLSISPLDFGAGGLGFISQYGAMKCGYTGVGRNGGDVKFAQSSNGVILYIYFEFANGFVGCIKADCLEQL